MLVPLTIRRYMKPRVLALATVVAALLAVGCDDSDPAPAEPVGKPQAFFSASLFDTGSAFNVAFTNRSTASDGTPAASALNLSHLWGFEGKGTDSGVTPQDRLWSYDELGLVAGVDGTSTRVVTLDVTEDNDPTRAGRWTETLIFKLEASVSASLARSITVWSVPGDWSADPEGALEHRDAEKIWPEKSFYSGP